MPDEDPDLSRLAEAWAAYLAETEDRAPLIGYRRIKRDGTVRLDLGASLRLLEFVCEKAGLVYNVELGNYIGDRGRTENGVAVYDERRDECESCGRKSTRWAFKSKTKDALALDPQDLKERVVYVLKEILDEYREAIPDA